MEIRNLKLTNFRKFKQGEFVFRPGINLIVGINGAGKSSVLDAIRIALSQVLPDISVSRNKKRLFDNKDVGIGRDDFEIQLEFLTEVTPFRLGARYEAKSKTSSIPQYEIDLKPDHKKILSMIKNSETQPLAIYFSPHRSLPILKETGNPKNVSSKAFAFVNSLEHRELLLHEYAAWLKFQSIREKEQDERLIFEGNVDMYNETIYRFGDGWSNMRVEEEKLQIKTDKNGNVVKQTPKYRFLIDKDGLELDFFQLSDGERGVLSLVIDLTRRLSYANPHLDNPARDGKAVVLIDELDLHLHPGWQRDIATKLTQTFPNCQFIATTHSPIIIGEVPPENIILLEGGNVINPDQSLGMDTNWILEYLMGTASRNETTEQELDAISELIEEEKFDEAQREIDRLRADKLARDPELVKLQTRLDTLQILGNDEE